MISRPRWSWLDALVIGVLLAAGTSAMVEARNRVVIDPPEAADLLEAVRAAPVAARTTKLCAVTALTGDIMFVPYAGQAAAAMAETPPVICPN